MYGDRVAIGKTVNRLDYGQRPEVEEAEGGDYGAYLEWVVETCGSHEAGKADFEAPMSYEEWQEMNNG